MDFLRLFNQTSPITATRRAANSDNTLRSHQLALQSIPTTYLVTVSHSNHINHSIPTTYLMVLSHSDHINSPCSQFQRHILWSCLTPITSTRRVVNSDDFSNDPRSTHRIKYMSNKLGTLRLSTCVTHLIYMLQLEGEC